MQNKIGLIAGNGLFPILLAQAAKEQGCQVIAVAIKEETSPDLAQQVERIQWISLGELKKLFKFFQEEQIDQAVMAGQIKPAALFGKIAFDDEFLSLLKEAKDRKADSLLKAVAERLGTIGVKLLDSTIFLKRYLAQKGQLTKSNPTQSEWEDIAFGFETAKQIAGLDIGQTVVVKNKAILAIEAIEGTDEAIRRAAVWDGLGVVVVKVSKPKQDMRFDVPVIGLETISVLDEVKARVLAVEAGKTLFLQKERCFSQAENSGICIVGV
jgi:DUF1009 family protein